MRGFSILIGPPSTLSKICRERIAPGGWSRSSGDRDTPQWLQATTLLLLLSWLLHVDMMVTSPVHQFSTCWLPIVNSRSVVLECKSVEGIDGWPPAIGNFFKTWMYQNVKSGNGSSSIQCSWLDRKPSGVQRGKTFLCYYITFLGSAWYCLEDESTSKRCLSKYIQAFWCRKDQS